jgi:mRNA-degrading endonuclease RelE of RelBE toxin-antitoxin system
MANESLPIFFTPEFKRNLRQLAKKYPHIRADAQPVIDAVEEGECPGDRISGTRYQVFKVRARNSDARKGKSGGYGIIYQVKPQELIVLVTIYSKSEQADVSAAKIRRIIADFETTDRGGSDAGA